MKGMRSEGEPDSGEVTARLVSVFNDPSDQVQCLAYSPTDTALGAACLDGSIWLWNPATGDLIQSIHDQEAPRLQRGRVPIPRIAFSPDGVYLVAAIGNHRIRLYSVEGERVASFTPPSDTSAWTPTDVAFSADGVYVLAGDTRGDLHAWEVSSGRYVEGAMNLVPASHMHEVFQGDVTTFVGCFSTGHDPRLLGLISTLETCAISALSPSFTYTAGGGTVIHTGKVISQSFAFRARAPAFSTTGDLVALLHPDPRRINILDGDGLQVRSTCSLVEDIPVSGCFVWNDQILAIAGGNSGHVWLWDIARAAFIGSIPSHTGGWGSEGPAWKIGALSSDTRGSLLTVAGMDYPDGVEPNEAYYGPVDWTVKLWALSRGGEQEDKRTRG